MMLKKLFLVPFFALTLGGCAGTHYAYQSHGTLKFAEGDERPAMIYWKADEGKKEISDTDVSLKVCNATEKSLVPTDSEAKDFTLTLRSRQGDLVVAEVDASGNVTKLEKADRVRPKEGEGNCARVYVEDEAVGMEGLKHGSKPRLAFLCYGRTGDDEPRYPAPESYAFGEITREEAKEDWNPELACEEPQE